MDGSSQVARGDGDWKFVPGLAVEEAAARLRRATSPLLEEERNPRFGALITHTPEPISLNGPRSWSALTTRNNPSNPEQVESHRAEQRFYRQEPNGSRHLP